MESFFRLVSAGPSFFLSAWIVMLFAGIAGGDLGIRPIGYLGAMLVTIGLWLAVVPAIAAVGGRSRKKGRS